MIVKKIAIILMLVSFSFMAGAVEKTTKASATKAKATIVKKAEMIKRVATPVKSKALGWSKDDPACKVAGGRYLCSRACNKDEKGPSGKACKSKQDTGTNATYCDCGTKTNGPSAIGNTAIQKL